VPLLLFFLLGATPAWAQRGARVSLVGQAGAMWAVMKHENRQFEPKAGFTGGALINYGINDHIGVQFGLLVSEQRVKLAREEFTTMTIQTFDLQFRWNILPDLWQPYLFVGGDYNILSLDPPFNDESDLGVDGGVGFEAHLTDHISVGVFGRYSRVFAKEFTAVDLYAAAATVAFAF
jgi:opacity protein-like surface antigen